MGLNLNSVYQSPYVVKDGRGLVRRKQDEDATQQARQSEQEEQTSSQARSKGLQYVEDAKTQYASSFNNVTPTQSQRAQHLYGQYVQNATGNTTQKPSAIAQGVAGRSASINIAQILKDFKNTALMLEPFI